MQWIIAQTTVSEATWLTIAERFGLPVIFLAMMCLALYKAAKWIGQNIAVPFVSRTVASVDHTDLCVDKMTEAMQGVRMNTEAINRTLEELKKLNNDQSEHGRETRKNLDQLLRMVEELRSKGNK